MSNGTKAPSHPYESYTGTVEWTVVDRAIRELVENRDLKETTAHSHIVGYLCKALVERTAVNSKPKRTREELRAIIAAAREEYQAKNPGRDPVAELIAERREAALRGD
jgi:hypothetical protein